VLNKKVSYKPTVSAIMVPAKNGNQKGVQVLSKKTSLQQGKLNAEILWYSFNPQYNNAINRT